MLDVVVVVVVVVVEDKQAHCATKRGRKEEEDLPFASFAVFVVGCAVAFGRLARAKTDS